MPYELKKVKGGWKVQKKGGEKMRNGRRYASDKPLTLENAKKQLAALYIAEGTYRITSAPNGAGYKVCRRDGKKMKNGRYHSTNKHLTYEQARNEKRRLRKNDREEYDSTH